MFYQLKVSGQDFKVEIGAQQANQLRVTVNGTPYDVAFVQPAGAAIPQVGAVVPAFAGQAFPAAPAVAATPAAVEMPATAAAASPAPAAQQGAVLAPIPGLIVQIAVQVGESVIAGQTVAVMEAMKMENNLVCQADGTVLDILVQKGAEVSTGQVIMHIG